MKQLGFILALIFILMPMASLAQDRISENLNLKNELYLKSFDFEPKQIDTRDSEQTVNFLATIYAKNGLMNNSSTGFATQATFLGPYSFWDKLSLDNLPSWFSKPEKNVIFLSLPVLGDAINGTYKSAIDFPKGTAQGVWQLKSIKLVDSKGQMRELKGDDLASLPQELNVKVGKMKWTGILIGIPLIFLAILLGIGIKIGSENLKKIPGLGNGIRDINKGYDKNTSSSKFQFLIWVCVTLYAYIIVIADAYFNHRTGSLGLTVPDNLLLAMGLSTTTMLAAKGITSKYAEEGKVDKSGKDQKGGLFYDDRGFPDLSQIQLISWTVIGVGIFLLKTLSDVIGSPGAVTGLPDIDQTLLMLIGIGQGAYIGKKIITTDDPEAPTLDNMDPKSGTSKEWISLTGKNFGEKVAGSITINGKTVQFKPENQLKWTEQMIQFKLEDIDTDKDKDLDTAIKDHKTVKIGVIAGKKSSAKREDFTIK